MDGKPHGYQMSTVAAGAHRSMAFARPCDLEGRFNAESIGADLLRIAVCDANSCIDRFLNDLTPCHVGQHAETCESVANLHG